MGVVRLRRQSGDRFLLEGVDWNDDMIGKVDECYILRHVVRGRRTKVRAYLHNLFWVEVL